MLIKNPMMMTNTGQLLRGLSLPRKSVSKLTDRIIVLEIDQNFLDDHRLCQTDLLSTNSGLVENIFILI